MLVVQSSSQRRGSNCLSLRGAMVPPPVLGGGGPAQLSKPPAVPTKGGRGRGRRRRRRGCRCSTRRGIASVCRRRCLLFVQESVQDFVLLHGGRAQKGGATEQRRGREDVLIALLCLQLIVVYLQFLPRKAPPQGLVLLEEDGPPEQVVGERRQQTMAPEGRHTLGLGEPEWDGWVGRWMTECG